MERAAPGSEPSNSRSGKGKGLFTGTLQNGIEPRAVGTDMMRQDFETRPGTASPLGFLTEVIDSLEMERNLEMVSSEVLAADLSKIALKVSSGEVLSRNHPLESKCNLTWLFHRLLCSPA